jgi:RHS repeat-associated protein
LYDSSRQYASFAHKFTAKERDGESGLDNFGARYNSSNIGRFMSPDPDNAGARPWAPQSWNAYSYVLNNPLKYVDPSGLDCIYLNEAGTGVDHVLTGGNPDCTNAGGKNDNGYYVDGTVDQSSIAFTGGDANRMFYTYTNQNTPGHLIGNNCVGDCSGPDMTVRVPAPMPDPNVTTMSAYPGTLQSPQQNQPTTFWQRLSVVAGCSAGLDPELMGPMNANSEAPKNPPNDSTKETEGQKRAQVTDEQGSQLKYRNGKPIAPNPQGSRNAEGVVAAAGGVAAAANAAQCVGNAARQ